MEEERNLNIIGDNNKVTFIATNVEGSSVGELSIGNPEGGVDMSEEAMQMDGASQRQQVIPDNVPESGPGENDGKVNEKLAAGKKRKTNTSGGGNSGPTTKRSKDSDQESLAGLQEPPNTRPKRAATTTKTSTRKKASRSKSNYFKAFTLEVRADFFEADGKMADWIMNYQDLIRLQNSPLKYYFKVIEYNLMNKRDIVEEEEQKRSLAIGKKFSSVPPDIEDIITLVDLYIEKEKYLRALILVKWANDYGKFDTAPPEDFDFENEFAPNDEMKPDSTSEPTFNEHYNMSQLIYRAYFIIRKRISKIGSDKLKSIAETYGEPLMVGMYTKMKKIQRVELNWKVRREAVSCHLLGSVQGCLKMSRKAIKSSEESIAMLEKQFGDGAKKFQTIGHAHHIMGFANKLLGRERLAIENLEKAIQAKKMATDFKNEHTRRGYIKFSEDLLTDVRKC